ncbi:hypothetical protein J3459_015270 [Metarhizium acridum]|nr:hypothetical protein J3459_015270 [Metarhizium acridum]
MSVRREGHVLDDMTGSKSANPTITNASQKDLHDRHQLARLGKKSVLRVRRRTTRATKHLADSSFCL